MSHRVTQHGMYAHRNRWLSHSVTQHVDWIHYQLHRNILLAHRVRWMSHSVTLHVSLNNRWVSHSVTHHLHTVPCHNSGGLVVCVVVTHSLTQHICSSCQVVVPLCDKACRLIGTVSCPITRCLGEPQASPNTAHKHTTTYTFKGSQLTE